MGDHSQWEGLTATHLTLYFHPCISPKPLFLPKIVTQSPVFFTLSRILEIFHSKIPNRLEFEKKVPKCPLFLWLLSLKKNPYFLPCIHMVCLRGMLLPQTQSEAGKFCILETESCKLVNTFRCKFNKKKVMKIEFQFYRLNRPNCALWMNFIGGQGWYTGYHPPSQTRKGIYPTTTLYNLHTWLSKQMPSVPEDVRAEAF